MWDLQGDGVSILHGVCLTTDVFSVNCLISTLGEFLNY